MTELTEAELMTRAAWLYYVAGLNQEVTSRRLGLTRARVNRLLRQARELGVVSITVNENDLGLLKVEETIREKFGLEFCITTPVLGDAAGGDPEQDVILRMVGTAGARFLRDRLTETPAAVVGVGWGRTLAYLARQMAGVTTPNARFISLMGSLTANSSFNPFDVVHALAQCTGGSGFFLPVPFIVDASEDRERLLSQQAVRGPMELARTADIALISVGELTENSLLCRSGMVSRDDIGSLRTAGAVGDTNGIFFDEAGEPVEHPLNRRCVAIGLHELGRMETVLLSGGRSKVAATRALLNSGRIRGLIMDGDSAKMLAE